LRIHLVILRRTAEAGPVGLVRQAGCALSSCEHSHHRLPFPPFLPVLPVLPVF
jgi:hypothetical protein